MGKYCNVICLSNSRDKEEDIKQNNGKRYKQVEVMVELQKSNYSSKHCHWDLDNYVGPQLP
jgi:hypothetical protein